MVAKSIENYPAGVPDDAAVTPDGLVEGSGGPDAFLEIAIKCAQARQYDQSLQAIKEIKLTGNRLEALTKVAVEYAEGGQYNQALMVVKTIEERYSYSDRKAEALAKIVGKSTKAEPADKASQVLNQALMVAQTIIDNKYKVNALVAIASQYTEVGQKDKSSQILAQALQLTETMNFDDEKAEALAVIATQYAAVGQADKASKILAQALQLAENLVVRTEERLALYRFCDTWRGLPPKCWGTQRFGFKTQTYN
jgi:tetratricopeptide (TPR) repeat protein